MEQLILENLFNIFITMTGLVATYLTIYFKLKSSFSETIDQAIKKELQALEAKHELRIQALEIKTQNIDEEQVKKEDLVEVRLGLKNITMRFDDLRDLLRDLHSRE